MILLPAMPAQVPSRPPTCFTPVAYHDCCTSAPSRIPILCAMQFPLSASAPVNGGPPPIMEVALSFMDATCGGAATAKTFLTDITFDGAHPGVTITKVGTSRTCRVAQPPQVRERREEQRHQSPPPLSHAVQHPCGCPCASAAPQGGCRQSASSALAGCLNRVVLHHAPQEKEQFGAPSSARRRQLLDGSGTLYVLFLFNFTKPGGLANLFSLRCLLHVHLACTRMQLIILGNGCARMPDNT